MNDKIRAHEPPDVDARENCARAEVVRLMVAPARKAGPPVDDADSLSLMYLHYRQDVINFVRGKFGPGPPEPEDVAQAVFLQIAAHSDVATLRSPRSFLLKSAQNLVL